MMRGIESQPDDIERASLTDVTKLMNWTVEHQHQKFGSSFVDRGRLWTGPGWPRKLLLLLLLFLFLLLLSLINYHYHYHYHIIINNNPFLGVSPPFLTLHINRHI